MKSQYNIVILGNSGVGKTSILKTFNAYLEDKSSSQVIRDIKTTEKAIVYDNVFEIKVQQKKSSRWTNYLQSDDINLKILDTGGQSKYKEDRLGWLGHELETKNIDGCIIVHDLSDGMSMINTKEYYDFIKRYTTTISIVDFGNKSDMMKIQTRPKYKEYTDSLNKIFSNFKWFETSCRIGMIEGNLLEGIATLISMIAKVSKVTIERPLKRSRVEYTFEEETKQLTHFSPNASTNLQKSNAFMKPHVTEFRSAFDMMNNL